MSRIVIQERQTNREECDNKLEILNILFLAMISLTVEKRMKYSS